MDAVLSEISYPEFPTSMGYMTEAVRTKYIEEAIARKLLPENAHRMPEVLSLTASTNLEKPIQFWQLFSVLGPDRIVAIVADFYQRVFDDEDWFRSVFERVGPLNHHINTQASMWADTMGGGPYYHGAEFRLNFHHTHNAHQLMDEKGARRWVKLMVQTLDACDHHMTDDARVRPAINTFLTYFLARYADDFKFENQETFGETNPPLRLKVNFMNMTNEAIAAMSENDLRDALTGRGVDVSNLKSKQELVEKATSL